MEIFFIGYLSGCTSVIAIWIFFNARGKGDSPESLKRRISRNNINTGQGLEELRNNNTETERLNQQAEDTATAGLKIIDNTNRTVSSIIANAKRANEKESKG